MSDVRWSPLQRVGFRFGFVYLVLYELPFILKRPLPSEVRPWVERVASFEHVVRWFGQYVLRITDPLPLCLGGGDCLFQWVRVVFLATVSTVVAVVWSLRDGRRASYPLLFEGLRVYVRYGLAFVMLFYGVVKLLPIQFQPPTLNTLFDPFGDTSPMGLLWRFMGASRHYTFFTGLVETAGAVLLLWRRTTLVGALLLVAALGNVVMLNLSYGVPVKLRSLHLLVMAAFLVAPDAPSLARFLLLHRDARLSVRPITFSGRRLAVARPWLKAAIVLWCSWLTVRFARDSARHETTLPPLYGIWLVESGSPVGHDAVAWHHVVFNERSQVEVERLDDSRQDFDAVDDDVATHTLTFKREDGAIAAHYERPDANHLVLRVTGEGQAAVLKLLREHRDFPLVTSGFQWIQ